MNKFVKVSYSLYTVGADGKQELVEKATPAQPFQFITGMGVALDAFEARIADLEQGAAFDFQLSTEEAYGPYLDEHVIDLDREMFCVDGHFDRSNVYPGAVIPLMNEDGNRFQGIVKEVGTDKVKIDLNHPLAGQDLLFKGTVIESREATNKEIEGFINMSCSEGCECGCGGDCGCDHHHGHAEAHGEGCGCGHHHHHA